ncbi:MAG TPA: prolyl oligopeptidase family serine peptidase [Gemmatimonadaceae bacterium]|nr:prolyl oligopeptidase family serine peptidase [Gemmatimonadaceae bacterium]
MPRSTRALPAIAALLAVATAPLSAQAPPPVARAKDVVDTLYGTVVHDPYRWMEAPDNPQLLEWMKAQSWYTRGVLDAIPGHSALQERLDSLSNAGIALYNVSLAPRLVLYEKLLPGDDVAKLYVRDGMAGEERLLVDPQRSAKQGTHNSLDYFAPSLDGKYVAYGISSGGSEASVLHIVEVATGRVVADSIDRAQFGPPAWLPDGRSFLYNRLQKLSADAPPTAKYENSKIFRHTLGTSPEADRAEIGVDVNALVPVSATEGPFASMSAGSLYVVAVVTQFVRNEVQLYAEPVAQLRGGATPWRKIADFDDEVTGFAVHGDDIFLLTHKDAPRFRIVRTSLSRPDLAHAKEVVPTSEAVITNLGAAKDALYVQQLDGGIARIVRVPYGANPRQVRLPFDGSIGELVTDPRESGALLKLSSWTKSQLWYRFDPVTSKVTDTKLRPPSPVDYSEITSEEVKAPSADGTLIPLSIIYKKGLEKDGSHPTLLSGYGAYGVTQDPAFSPLLLAWLERGGVYAVAHVRGGGEYGEEWHQAGQKLTKQNTISDFVACAEYLIQQGYTSPSHLSGEGRSAGGILIGGAITQRPELFAAALDEVGASDMVRMELTPNGPTNTPEFGSVATEDGFKGLYAMSAYHHVKDGTVYPAVLLNTGLNDPRVAPWQVAKMAARLQAATSGSRPTLLLVDSDAGHGIGSTRSQAIALLADQWSFLFWQLGQPEFQPGRPTASP